MYSVLFDRLWTPLTHENLLNLLEEQELVADTIVGGVND
jgi:hypothetical protein